MASPQKCCPRLRRQFSSGRTAYFSPSETIRSQSFETHASWKEKSVKRSKVAQAQSRSFETLGLHPPILTALRSAFPDIKRPTSAQQQLIPAVVGGQDVALQDRTGSGKSFGLVLALLNRSKNHHSLFIVPHRDLAHQCYDWVERLFAPAATAPGFSISSIAQVLVRGSGGFDLSTLRGNPPHLLFATPQALTDAWRHHPDILRLKTLSAIVVDEADYLIPTVEPSRHSPGQKKLKKKQHPGETREFLNAVYGDTAQEDDDDYTRDRSPQLVISSATLPRTLQEEVSDWINRDWLSISTSSRVAKSPVSHSVLVVSEDLVRNIAGARQSSHDYFRPVDEATDDPVPEIDPVLAQKYAQTPSPFNPLALETVAMILAAEVPSTALLVIPSAAPVQRAVLELRDVGVHAHGLKDGLADGTRRPTLIVSTFANTRGLDLRGLSHVFVLGIPDGGPSAYVHIAGRVGRLQGEGRRGRGKVVLLVKPDEEDAARELLETIEEEAVVQAV
ncbi:P-loop containing nucleoside triphosphate hydrolase protein [Mycena filopes]|nr:P-loop containing nucleoside triphosphate hydrolase protein [Mycena filopes]